MWPSEDPEGSLGSTVLTALPQPCLLGGSWLRVGVRQGSRPQPQQPLCHQGFPGDLGSLASFGGVSNAPSQGLLELNQTGSGGVVSRTLGSHSSRDGIGF